MPTSELISVSEYLHTSYSPDCDYVDGLVMERNLGEWDHANLQGAFVAFLWTRRIVDPRTRKGYNCTPEAATETAVFRTENPDLVVPLDAVFEF